MAAQQPDTDLLLVGDGALRGELERQCRDLGLSSRVRFLGVRDDVADILRAVDVFALTSVSEAASITLLKAMGSGLPVVVTAVGGNPEIVRDGIDGLLAPRGDAQAIGTALTRLLEDPSFRTRLGQNGAARVHSAYRLDQTVDMYYDLYATLARSRRAA